MLGIWELPIIPIRSELDTKRIRGDWGAKLEQGVAALDFIYFCRTAIMVVPSHHQRSTTYSLVLAFEF
jgi:hypothetical protein